MKGSVFGTCTIAIMLAACSSESIPAPEPIPSNNITGVVSPTPTLALSTPMPITASQSFTIRGGFTDDDASDGPWSWKLERDGTIIRQGVQQTLPPPGFTLPATLPPVAAGNHVLVLSVTDRNGTQGVDTLIVPVIPNGGPSQVTVVGRQLRVRKRLANGQLGATTTWVMRGATWSPASPATATSPFDPNNASVRRPEFWKWVTTDAPLLGNMHVNTVRTYLDTGVDTTDAIEGYRVLNELYAKGIMVVLTVDDAINDQARVNKAVQLYKAHPALLFYLLGNEWNINKYYGQAISIPDAALKTEQAAALIKSLDPAHPVGTGYGEIDINSPGQRLSDTQQYVNLTCPSVDIWGVNICRGSTFTTLFQQWTSISTKPMFVAEYGTDAWATLDPFNPANGHIDEAAQAQWDTNLWADIYRNLSATNPQRPAIGGSVFELSDEWWKVSPFGSQQPGGFIFPGAHPDGFANEEYFGLTDIARVPRQAYTAMQNALSPSTIPPAPIVGFGATSQGYITGGQEGCSEFFRDGGSIGRVCAGAGGARGFNVAVIDSTTGVLLQPVQNFDTFGNGQVAWPALVAFLQALPNGSIILLSVADEAGLTDVSCNKFSSPWVTAGVAVLVSLGSTQIGSYCFRNSWSMITVQGEGVARAEQLRAGSPAPQAATSAAIRMK